MDTDCVDMAGGDETVAHKLGHLAETYTFVLTNVVTVGLICKIVSPYFLFGIVAVLSVNVLMELPF